MKLVNVGQPGCGQYRLEATSVQAGRTAGYVSRAKNSFYRCPMTGKEFPHTRCRPVWVAEDAQRVTLGVFSTRSEAVSAVVQDYNSAETSNRVYRDSTAWIMPAS